MGFPILYLHQRHKAGQDAVDLDQTPEPLERFFRHAGCKDIYEGLLLYRRHKEDLNIFEDFSQTVDQNTFGDND